MEQRVAEGEKRGKAWRKTQREIKQFFGLHNVSPASGGLGALNLNKGSGKYRKDNAVLLLFTGGFLASGGDTAMLQNLSDDFADDGQFNGVGLGDFNTIATLSASPDLLSLLAENMRASGINNPPNAADLPTLPAWVIATDADTTPPVISLNGGDVNISVGNEYEDAGATAIDDRDGEVEVVTTGVVDTSVTGEYTITYTATDIAGNTAENSRTVTVSDESGAPQLIADRSLDTIIVDGVERSTVFSVSHSTNTVIFYQPGGIQVDMRRGNQGGITTNWSIDNFDFTRKRNDRGRPLSSSPYLNYITEDVFIDAETGALTVEVPSGQHGVAGVTFDVTATNSEGSSVMHIEVNFSNPNFGR